MKKDAFVSLVEFVSANSKIGRQCFLCGYYEISEIILPAGLRDRATYNGYGGNRPVLASMAINEILMSACIEPEEFVETFRQVNGCGGLRVDERGQLVLGCVESQHLLTAYESICRSRTKAKSTRAA